MENITFQGNKVSILGNVPEVGSKAPDFKLVSGTLEEITLDTYAGKKKLLNIAPSFDTGTCATSAKTFETKAGDNFVILNISRDTPFAQGRFCQAENIQKSIFLSDIHHTLGKDYGVEITSAPLAPFLTRTVIVLDESNIVQYVQVVPEIVDEPDYDAALRAL